MKQSFLSSILFLVCFGIFIFFDRLTEPNLHGLEKKAIDVQFSVSNINNGGCGWFALYASDYLDKQNIPYEIVYIFATDNKGQIPNHVMIKLKDDWYFDDNGFHHEIYLKVYGSNQIVHSKEDLRKLLNEPGWNEKFNVDDTVIINHLIWK